MTAHVVAVSRSGRHTFTKRVEPTIKLIAGLGIEGDAHQGVTVKHVYLVRKDPTQPNLRQVHLIHAELFDELAGSGFALVPGEIGENITTRGLDLLGLPTGARLRLGADAVVEITGLRNPCKQLDNHQAGLTAAMLARDGEGHIVRKSGVMAIVIAGGEVKAHDAITVELPAEPHRRLEAV